MLTLSSEGTEHVLGPGLNTGFLDVDGLAEAERDGRDGPPTKPLETDGDGVAVVVPVFVGDVDIVVDGAGDPPGVRETDGVSEMLGETLAVTLNDRLGVDDGEANRDKEAVIDGDGVAVAVPVIVGLAGTVVASTMRARKGTKASLSSELGETISRLLSITFEAGLCRRLTADVGSPAGNHREAGQGITAAEDTEKQKSTTRKTLRAVDDMDLVLLRAILCRC